MSVVQFTDPHIVREGTTRSGSDTAAFLSDAIDTVNASVERTAYVVVTGDLVDRGTRAEYERFARVMSRLRVPYYVIPGNHDDRERLREVLDPATFGASRDARIRYCVDDAAIRFIGLDAGRTFSPGAALDVTTLAWLETALAAAPQRPTIVGVHQPPFRTGVHYLDAFGFGGRRELRAIVDRTPCVGRVIGGHVHCVRSARWAHATVLTAPSTAPQYLPLVFMERKLLGLRVERPGFARHTWHERSGFATTIYRRTDGGDYAAETMLPGR